MPFIKKEDSIQNPLLEAINEIKRISDNVLKSNEPEIVDVMRFCNSPEYLDLPGSNFNLFLSQRVILKCFYMNTRGNEGVKLNKEEWEWLYEHEEAEERDGLTFEKNGREVINKLQKMEKAEGDDRFTFRELCLVLGRRGSKCHEETQLIPTTVGSISFRDLCDRVNSGERIGICTYHPETLKRSITYDIKLEDNGVVDCFKVQTKRGFEEVASYNHPYLVWRDEWDRPKFIDISKIKTGDKIAIAENTELFGKGKIGKSKSALLGYFQGDGGITHSIRFTTQDKNILAEFRDLIRKEFGGKYVVNHVENYDYTVVKKSGRFKQDGSQKNEVKEWLKTEGCHGKLSKNKVIPKSILEGSKEEVATFLSRLFACDGWASTEKKVRGEHGGAPKSCIGICSASKDLMKGVSHLLHKFGIHSVVTEYEAKLDDKKFKTWRLSIVRQADIFKFANEIGIFSKEKALNLAVKMAKTRSESKGEFESVPKGIWNYINNLIRKKWFTRKQIIGSENWNNERLRMQYTPNVRKVKMYGENIGDTFLKDIGGSDVKWDVVKSIEKVGKKNTIAMEVKGTNIIGTDFVSHNTILASVITAYEIYKLLVIGGGDPHKFYGLPYDDEIAIINVALSQEQSGRLFGQVQARIRNSPFFKGRIAKETTKEIRFYTDKDLEKKNKGTILSIPGSILMLCGHSNPDTLRGYSTILILFDELAFYDDVGKVTGQAFYNALKPSLAKFKEFGDGRLVEISSPNSMSGIFYNIFMDSKKEDNILALQLPTWCSNPDISYEGLRIDRQRNPEMFSIEYGAQWAKTSAMGPFFPEGLIERCIRLDIGPHDKPQPGYNYHIHVDPANGGDRYVLVLVAKKYYKNLRGQKRNMVYLANVKIYEPVPGIGLQFNVIDKDVLRICSIFHPMTVSYDSWNSIQSLQMLRSHGVRCIPTTYNRNYKLKIYQNLLDMMSYVDGPELLLYDDPLLILEMKALKKKQIQRGLSIVKDKNGIVKTDDVVDCLAGAVSMASGHVRASLPEPVCVNMGFR